MKIAPEKIEEWFLEAAEQDGGALRELTAVFQALPAAGIAGTTPPWQEAFELFLDSLPADAADPPVRSLLLAVARAGLDSPLLRDHLAAAARRAFSRFLDPSTMLKALGVHDDALPMPEITARWNFLETLAPGQFGLHPAHGIGRITALDPLSGTLTINFGRPRPLPLPAAAADLWLIPEDSPLFPALAQKTTFTDGQAKTWNLERLEAAGVPQGRLDTSAIRRFLSPIPFSEKQLSTLFGRTPKPTSPADAPAPGRPVAASRNLLEALESLRRVPADWQPEEMDWNVVRSHLETEKSRVEQVERFAETLALLVQADPDSPRGPEIARELENAACWETPERFSAVSIALAGRHIPAWFQASLWAKGGDWFAEAAHQLPFRLIRRAWETAKNAGKAAQFLEHAHARLDRGSAPADLLVWLWNHGKAGETRLRNPQMLLRALNEDAHGPFIEARKQLRKLLLDNTEFQKFLLDDGNPKAVSALVRAVLHLPGLDAGERQSLLVKIVRLYPDARALVEQKTPVHTGEEHRRTERLITSMRSYELRRRELEEIINVKIPANSRAIAHARGYGDLRENAEYKAAKEMQRVLGRRQQELQQALNEVVPTDFSTVQVNDAVVPGCIVVLEREDRDAPETITLLGLWDSDPKAGILSYKTELGQALLGKRAGDSLELPRGGRAIIREVRPLPETLLPWLRGEDLPPVEARSST